MQTYENPEENTEESLTRALARADRLERELAESRRELERVQALVAARPARKKAAKKAAPMCAEEMRRISQTLGTAAKLAAWLGETFAEHDALRAYVAKLVKAAKTHFDRPAKGAKTLSRTVVPAFNALAKAVQMDLEEEERAPLARAMEDLARAMAWRKLTAEEPISAPAEEEDREDRDDGEDRETAEEPLERALRAPPGDTENDEDEEADEEEDLGEELAGRFKTLTLERELDTSQTFRELFGGREAECENHSAFVCAMNGKMKVVSYKGVRLASCMNGKWVLSQSNADTPLDFIE